MAIIENDRELLLYSGDKNGNFFIEITKTYPIQLKLCTHIDFATDENKLAACNVSEKELEELQELINRALIHFR
ncbi:hypothetical protein [Pedobacter sp.]|uniref:hypothetical protein n=1 Tax=Pedobacter sp. TaxID=1411316 RepID=UPI0031DC039E